MSAPRYVLLGLEAAGTWPASLRDLVAARDADDEYLPCDGPADLLSRLATGRRFSAVLVDQRASGLDRELVRRSLAADCPVIVVGGPADAPRLLDLGATVHVPDPDDGGPLDDALAVALADHAHPIGPVDDLRFGPRIATPSGDRWTGRLVAVTGPGGSGASTVARALAAGLVDDPRLRGEVLLVDACLQADQAHLHGIDEPTSDLRAATQAHRGGDPDGTTVRSLLTDPPGCRYRLLPGIRRRGDWPAIGGPTLTAALRNLRDHHLATVVDVDPMVDLAPVHQPVGPATPGEPSRIVVELADLVVLVHHAGAPRRAADRVADDLAEAGLPTDRLVRFEVGDARRRTLRGRRRDTRRDDRHAPSSAADLLATEPLGDPRTAADLASRILGLLDRLPARPDGVDLPVATGSLGTGPSGGGIS